VEEKPVINVGGNIEKAIAGDYKIDTRTVLSEAWKLTQKSRAPINLSLAISFGIGMLASMFLIQFLGGFDAVMEDQGAHALINIVVTLVISPFLVGVEMIGIYHAIGIQTKTSVMFSFLKRGSWVAIVALFTSTLTSLGLQLFVLPGLFLLVIFSLTLPLVAEKQLSPIQAIVVSTRALWHQWFQIFFSYLAIFALFVLAMVPVVSIANTPYSVLGVVLFLFFMSYLAPMFYHLKGVLYREIFGMKLQITDKSQQPPMNTFSA